MVKNVRTDLAVETIEPEQNSLPKGVRFSRRDREGVPVEEVEVLSAEGSKALGKPIGRYITMTLPPLWKGDGEAMEAGTALLAEYLREMLPKEGMVLTLGLGNPGLTADSLGPKTAAGILATRHLTGLEPEFFRSLRPCAVLAPGVLGQTGLESAELAAAVTERFRPGAVIVVDALAAGDTARLGTTVQLSDSGIAPGAGAMNRRMELNEATLMAPVFSLGIPTVCEAYVFASSLLGALPGEVEAGERRQMEGFLVTPKEIDQLSARGAAMLSAGINRALQPNLTKEELAFLTA